MLHPVSSYVSDAPENTAEARHRAWTSDLVFIGASPKAMDNEVAAFPEACLKRTPCGHKVSNGPVCLMLENSHISHMLEG